MKHTIMYEIMYENKIIKSYCNKQSENKILEVMIIKSYCNKQKNETQILEVILYFVFLGLISESGRLAS